LDQEEANLTSLSDIGQNDRIPSIRIGVFKENLDIRDRAIFGNDIAPDDVIITRKPKLFEGDFEIAPIHTC